MSGFSVIYLHYFTIYFYFTLGVYKIILHLSLYSGCIYHLFILFLISAIVDIESPQDPHVNLLVIITSSVGLAMWVWNASGGVYKKWYLNALESSFIFNLAILAAATLYTKLAGGSQAAVFYTSVSVAFTTFIGIITMCTND